MSNRRFLRPLALASVVAGAAAVGAGSPSPAAAADDAVVQAKSRRKTPAKSKPKTPARLRAAQKKRAGDELAKKLSFALRLIQPVTPGKANKEAYHYSGNRVCSFREASCTISCRGDNPRTADRLPKVTLDLDVKRLNISASSSKERFHGTWLMSPSPAQPDTGRFFRKDYPPAETFALSLSSRFSKPDVVVKTRQRPLPGCQGWECGAQASGAVKTKFGELYLMKHRTQAHARDLAKRFVQLRTLCLPPRSSSGAG